jgi:hypothetical protein
MKTITFSRLCATIAVLLLDIFLERSEGLSRNDDRVSRKRTHDIDHIGQEFN